LLQRADHGRFILTQSFTSLGLSAELTRAVADQGYTHPTPVQVQAIPVILEGRDVLAGAQTGTGKTAGFTLPMLQRLSAQGSHSSSPARHPVRALIVTPTRELAAQVEESVRTYGKHSPLRSTLIYGGVGIKPQIEALRRGVDILVATPGRLLDHVEDRASEARVAGLADDRKVSERVVELAFDRGFHARDVHAAAARHGQQSVHQIRAERAQQKLHGGNRIGFRVEVHGFAHDESQAARVLP
jgi:ATP-dependent RNA helicase RhlE